MKFNKVEIKNEYKSFCKSISIIDLPQFTILTGENGSGKTQFLKAIELDHISIIGKEENPLHENKPTLINYLEIQSTPYSTEITNVIDGVYNYHLTGTKNYGAQFKHEYLSYEQISNEIIAKEKKTSLSKEDILKWFKEKYEKCDAFDTSSLTTIFKNYRENLSNNLLARNDNRENLSDEDFEKKHGKKPWDVLNEILNEKTKLNFQFIAPTNSDLASVDGLVCINSDGNEFAVTDLSSGEKVLLNIALSLFSSEKDTLAVPNIILLDEIDSSLYPSMINNLLLLIEEVFIKKYDITVIMTTHSPTTVALADEKSLYFMQHSSENKIIKENKDKILKRLSYGIPTLAVTYSNRRNVITESEYDAKNFQKIFDILVARNYLSGEVSLNFIASGKNTSANSGNCDNVRSIVNSFGEHANVYGIIDWDNKNSPLDNVFVLAHEERYAIENCILDPIQIALLLLHTQVIEPTTFGLPKTFSLSNDFSIFEGKIQTISDCVVSKVLTNLKKVDDEIIEVEYICNKKITIPKTFLHNNGHKLETAMKNAFPELNEYRNSNGLLEKIIKNMNNYQQYIPKSILEIFEKIINK